MFGIVLGVFSFFFFFVFFVLEGYTTLLLVRKDRVPVSLLLPVAFDPFFLPSSYFGKQRMACMYVPLMYSYVLFGFVSCVPQTHGSAEARTAPIDQGIGIEN